MEFFNYAAVAGYFTAELWVMMLVGALCFALVYVFKSVALYTIASREGYNNKWMAFVPFLNTYYVGVVAQKNRFYNLDTRKVAIGAAVCEFVLVALYILYYVARYPVLEGNGYITYVEEDTGFGYAILTPYITGDLPAELEWAAWIAMNLNRYIIWAVELISVLVNGVVLTCFFQTYACNHYVIFTITSILFPIQGILFFVVRNNKGMNYKDFIAQRRAWQYQAYQQQQQYYNQNPYNQNPYNRNPNGQNNYGNPNPYSSNTKTDDPFGDYGSGSGTPSNGTPSNGSPSNGSSAPDDPFDEFDK